MEYALEISGLGKQYPDFTLKNVSFSLPRGYIMGLIGPNGAGKTTVIKLILNLVSRNSGMIKVLDLDHRDHEAEIKARLGFVLDEPPFYPYLRVKDIGALIAPFYPTWDGERFRKLCGEFEIPLRKRVGALSRGMKMKLALVSALSHSAELILMDEPTSGLDPVFRRELLERLSGLIQDGRTSVLFSTHITSDLERVADYITCLRNGELLFSLTREELMDRWALVKGDNGLLDTEISSLFVGVKKGPYGFKALTDRAAEVRQCLGSGGAVVEKADLDEIVFFLSGEGGHV